MKKALCIVLCAVFILLCSCSQKAPDSECYTAIKDCMKSRYFITAISDDEIKYVGKDKESGREEFRISVITEEADDVPSEVEDLTLFVEIEDGTYSVYNEKGSNIYTHYDGKN